MKWIDALDLDRWADRLDSHSRVPELLRRLVHATVAHPHRVTFPSGESTQLAGWDGLVENAEEHSFVPGGYSGWEISSRKDIKAKADEDYDNRKADPCGLVPETTTFVFVTPRRWPGGREWASEKAAEGHWAGVRAYNADDLEQWLELAPATGAWLARLVGEYPGAVWSLEDYLAEFLASTRPRLLPSLVLAGRETEQERIRQWLASAPSALNLVGDTSGEAVAFFGGAIQALPWEDRERHFSRAVVAEDLTVLRQASAMERSLTLIWMAHELTPVGNAISQGHHVLVPAGRGSLHSATDAIELPRLKRGPFVKALAEMGLTEEKARALARDTARSIPVLQRRLAVSGAVSTPKWAKPEQAQSLLPALLAGSWNDDHPADGSEIERLAGLPYAQVAATMTRWACVPDPPVRKLGSEWSLVSPLDAWHSLGRFVGDSELGRLETAVREVLGAEDPALELPPGDRWASAVYGKRPAWSEVLREGLVQTLVLLGVFGESLGMATNERPPQFAGRVVWKLLGNSPGWRRWYSASGLLPSLAEAAPESFLRAVEDELVAQAPEIMNLFQEEGWAGHSAHTGLLWALENLAWDPTYLGRVTLVLGKLARLDPGGKLANRPRSSLRRIFLAWQPQTAATLEQRLTALDHVVARGPEAGWNLLIDLLPKSHDWSHPTHRFRWRETPDAPVVTHRDCIQAFSAIIDRALRAADQAGPRLSTLIEQMGGFPLDAIERLKRMLVQFAESCQDDGERKQVWGALREFLNNHRKFKTADWALPEDVLVGFDEVEHALRPCDPVEGSRWLFDEYFPDLPVPHDTPFSEVEACAARARREAAATVESAVGREGLYSLARGVKFPGLVGCFAAELIADEEEVRRVLAETLAHDEQSIQSFGMGLARRSFEVNGWGWARGLLQSVSRQWTAAGKARLLLALPALPDAWELAGKEGSEVEELYWRHVLVPFLRGVPPESVEYGAKRLLDHARPEAALEVVSHQPERFASSLLIAVLERLAERLATDQEVLRGNVINHELAQVLAALRARSDVKEETVVGLEWMYFPLLGRPGSWGTPALHRALSRDPEMFAQLIRWVYRPRGAEEPVEAPTATERNRAHQAYELLSSWRTIPGIREDSSIDEAGLADWVTRARELCAASGHAKIADHHIGSVLAWAPMDPTDGIWPDMAVRTLLERVESGELEESIALALYTTKRGLVCKAADEGGAQEQDLAQRYREWADATTLRWPRTSRMLSQTAESFEHEARRADVRAEQDDLRFG